MSTIFQKIIDKEIEVDLLHEDELCIAFHDNNPQAPVHILIIPKTPIRSLADAKSNDESLIGHLLLVASHIAKHLEFSNEGYRVVINTNEGGGQTVYHLHVHLLAGRKFTWPPG